MKELNKLGMELNEDLVAELEALLVGWNKEITLEVFKAKAQEVKKNIMKKASSNEF